MSDHLLNISMKVLQNEKSQIPQDYMRNKFEGILNNPIVQKLVQNYLYNSQTKRVFPQSLVYPENRPDYQQIAQTGQITLEQLEKSIPMVMMTSSPVVKQARSMIQSLAQEARKIAARGGMAEKFVERIKKDIPGGIKSELRLPNVREGFVRLFRAEGGRFSHEDMWNNKNFPLPKNWVSGDSVFYSRDLKLANYYKDSFGKGSRVHYIDVPQKIVNINEFDPAEVFINKSQLTDFYNQATGGVKK